MSDFGPFEIFGDQMGKFSARVTRGLPQIALMNTPTIIDQGARYIITLDINA